MDIKQKKGISLIVLVITVVVMIILAAVIILSINGNGIMDNAGEAKELTNAANLKDAATVFYSNYITADALGKIDKDKYQDAYAYLREKLANSGFTTEDIDSVRITEDEIVIARVPEGFTVSCFEGETEIEDGLVIYETNAETLAAYDQENAKKTFNQFVWIPVMDYSKFKRINWDSDKDFSDYKEPYSGFSADNDPTGEFAEYTAMMDSVKKYGGFWVARYEAGKDGTTVVSKKGASIYTNVPWGETRTSVGTTGAVYLSRNMYTNNESFASHLIYGVEYDAVLTFIKEDVDVTNASSWGNYKDATGDAKPHSGSMRTSGFSEAWKAKNIYDLAGNAKELTMEMASDTAVAARGGNCATKTAKEESPSVRNGVNASIAFTSFSYRVALYIK